MLQEENITAAFFPIELCSLMFKKRITYVKQGDFFGNDSLLQLKNKTPKLLPVSGFVAVVDSERNHVFATVGSRSKIISNEDAYHAAEPIVREVFGAELSDLACVGVNMPTSRSSCQIDLVLRSDMESQAEWIPFLRISNSYIRSKYLRFEMGFVGSAAQSSVVTSGRVHRDEAARVFGGAAALRNKFASRMQVLRSCALTPNEAATIFCNTFNIKVSTDKLARYQEARFAKQRAALQLVAQQMTSSILQRFKEFGANAYALFNVMADFATHPVGCISGESMLPVYQRRVGAWVESFARATSSPDFSIREYTAGEASIWAANLKQFL